MMWEGHEWKYVELKTHASLKHRENVSQGSESGWESIQQKDIAQSSRVYCRNETVKALSPIWIKKDQVNALRDKQDC